METNPDKIKELSKEKENENWEFRSFLKCSGISREKIDSIVHELNQNVSSEIDCKTCANCCKQVQPVLDQEDIEKLAKSLGIPIEQFKIQYLVKDEESKKFVFKKKPCPFLKDNLCSQYIYRPKDCVSFPHLHKNGFTLRLMGMIGNCSICPIVYNVYEYLKNEIWHYEDFDEFIDYTNYIDIE
jgi:Fe-S-cluster containining protein